MTRIKRIRGDIRKIREIRVRFSFNTNYNELFINYKDYGKRKQTKGEDATRD